MEKNGEPITGSDKLKFRKLVAQGDLMGAADLLWKFAENYNEELVDEVVIIECGLSDLNKERRSGKIGFKEASEMKNQFADRLLGIAKSLFQYANRENAS